MLLVVGAGGQLGRELCALAASAGVPAHGLHREELDCSEPAQVELALAKWRPDVVVNAAAYNAVDRAECEQELADRVNALGPETIGRGCAQAGTAMIHISTDYVFDGTKSGAYHEDDPIAPLGVYGRSKAEGERRVRMAINQHVILRTSWLYGVHGTNFVKTIMRLASERDELRVVDDQIGCPTGTADLAAAILRVAEAARLGRAIWGTYHFAGRGAISRHGLACEIVRVQARVTGKRPTVHAISSAEYPSIVRRPSNSELDSTKFATVFGIAAAPWQDRVASVVNDLCGVRAIKGGQ